MKVVAIVMIATLMLISINYAYALDSYELESSSTIIEPSIFKVEPEIVEAKEIDIDIDDNYNYLLLPIIGIGIVAGVASMFIKKKVARLSLLFIVLLSSSIFIPSYASVEVKGWDLSKTGISSVCINGIIPNGNIIFSGEKVIDEGVAHVVGILNPTTNELKSYIAPAYIYCASFPIFYSYNNNIIPLFSLQDEDFYISFDTSSGTFKMWDREQLKSLIGIKPSYDGFLGFTPLITDDIGNIYLRGINKMNEYPYMELKIARLDTVTNTLTVWNLGRFGSYQGIPLIVDSNNLVYTAVGGSPTQFIRLDPITNQVTFWNYSAGNVIAEFDEMRISIDSNNNIYLIADYSNSDFYALIRFVPQTNVVEILHTTKDMSSSFSIMTDKNDNVWVVQHGSISGTFGLQSSKILPNTYGNVINKETNNMYTITNSTIIREIDLDKLDE